MGRGLKKVRGVHSIPQEEHVEASKAKRTIAGGFVAESFGNDIRTEVFIGPDKHVLVYNTSAATMYYVAAGDTGMATPAAGTGFPVLPQNQIVIYTGEDGYIRGSNVLDLKIVVLAD